MGTINIRRVITGGLVAGLVLNIIDVIVNVSLLGEQWIAGSLARGIDPKSVPLGDAEWVIVDFIAGVFLVWLYAAIRPRYGPGPKTALSQALQYGSSLTQSLLLSTCRMRNVQRMKGHTPRAHHTNLINTRTITRDNISNNRRYQSAGGEGVCVRFRPEENS